MFSGLVVLRSSGNVFALLSCLETVIGCRVKQLLPVCDVQCREAPIQA